jgi:hypothetical protein
VPPIWPDFSNITKSVIPAWRSLIAIPIPPNPVPTITAVRGCCVFDVLRSNMVSSWAFVRSGMECRSDAQVYPCPGSRKITETRERRLPVLTGDAK